MTLGDLFSISKGKKPPVLFDEPTEAAIPFIKIDGLRNAGQHQYCEVSPNLVTCERNDVLVVWDGAYCGLVGFNLEGAIGSTIARLRPTSEEVFGPYVGRLLQDKFEEIQKNATGAAIPHVNGGHLRRLEIPLPSLDEQKRIAAVLDKADALRRQRQESLQLTEKLLQSVFIDMFGDPGANPKEWGTLPLEELCDKIVDCPHSTPVYSDATTGFFCVRSSDIQNGKLDLASTRHVSELIFVERIARHEPKAGEVIYTREGGRLGFAAQVPNGKRICLGQRMMLFRAKEKVSTNTFLANLLNSESFRHKVLNLVGGGAAPRVNIKDLRTIVVYRPPFELQQHFERFAESLQQEEESLAQSEFQIRKLFSSLQQRAFRGELDLSRLSLVAERDYEAEAQERVERDHEEQAEAQEEHDSEAVAEAQAERDAELAHEAAEAQEEHNSEAAAEAQAERDAELAHQAAEAQEEHDAEAAAEAQAEREAELAHEAAEARAEHDAEAAAEAQAERDAELAQEAAEAWAEQEASRKHRVYNRPGYFIAPPDIEARMMELEDSLDAGSGDFIAWSEDYFKYRTLSQLLRPPFSFSDIWEMVEYDMEEANYETVKDKVFEYVKDGTLRQRFCKKNKEIVFFPNRK